MQSTTSALSAVAAKRREVFPSYFDLVMADSPLFYHRLASASGNDPDALGGASLTLAGGITRGIAGGVPGNNAMTFNGTSGAGQRAVVLSPYTAITIEFWAKAPTYTGAGVVFETTVNYNGTTGAFLLNFDTPGFLGAAVNAAVGVYNSNNFSVPSDANWHHYALTIDRSVSAAVAQTLYVDGVAVTRANIGSATVPSFADGTMYVAARAGTAFYLGGGMDEIAVYPTALSSGRIAAHYAASGPQPSGPEGFGLPQVFLTVADPGDINADTKTQATISILNAYGSRLSKAQRLVGNQYVDVKWAGNTTLLADKKAYNMTTLTAPAGSNNDVPLLGMAKGKDWRLLANAYDLTDMKNWFCMGLGDELDLPWTPHGRHCELYVNEVYQGTYFLAERVKRHTNRINIGNAASGAFLCEIVADTQADLDADLFTTPLMSVAGDPNGWLNFLLVSFAMEYGTKATADAAVNAFELALVAKDWATVWSQMDMAAAVDFFLWEDAIANSDAPRFGSVRICRDSPSGIKSGKLFFVGWDFDGAAEFPFYAPDVGIFLDPDRSRFVTNRWFSIMVQDPAFVAALVARRPSFGTIFESWLALLSQKADFLDSTGARARNFALNSGVTLNGNPYLYASPQDATDAAVAAWNARWDIMQADRFTPGGGANLIAAASGGGLDVATTSAVNSTGGNVAYVVVGNASASGEPAAVVTDSKGNTVTPFADYSTGVSGTATRAQIFRVNLVTTGPGHTFTATSTGAAPGISVAIFSFPFASDGAQNGAQVLYGDGDAQNILTGSVAHANSSLIIAGVSMSIQPAVATIDSGFVFASQTPFTAGVHFGSGVAYKLTNTSGSVNPMVGVSKLMYPAASIAAATPV